MVWARYFSALDLYVGVEFGMFLNVGRLICGSTYTRVYMVFSAACKLEKTGMQMTQQISKYNRTVTFISLITVTVIPSIILTRKL